MLENNKLFSFLSSTCNFDLVGVLSLLLFFPLHLIGTLIPKKETVWIMGTSSGSSYKGNSKYLFEFMYSNKNNNDYTVVWLSRNKNIIKQLRKEGKLCFHHYSLRGIYYSIVAKYIFLTHSYDDISLFAFLFPQKSLIVNLWHGVGPKLLKRGGKYLPFKSRVLRAILRFYLRRSYDYVVTTSDFTIDNLDAYFRVGKKRFLITGYPRNDALFKKQNVPYLDELKKRIHFKKLIFYLPTYRPSKTFNISSQFPNLFHNIQPILEKHNALLLIKLHPSEQYQNFDYYHDDIKNIKIITDINYDIYPLLYYTDILITDYSSVYIDFLLRNKPIIFYIPDKEYYQQYDMGFLCDFDKISPGLKANNPSQLVQALNKYFLNPKLHYKERLRVRSLFHKFHDGKSSLRIFRMLKKG